MSPSQAASEHLVIEPAFAPTLRAHGLDSLAALMRVEPEADLHKPGLATWRQRIRVEVDGQALFIKRYHRPPLTEQCAARLRGFAAVAGIEWHWLHALSDLGIPAARPVAFGYRRVSGAEIESVLVTAAVPGRSLEQWAEAERSTDCAALHEPAQRRSVLAEVATLVRRLHTAGLFHRDLYLSHLFFNPDAPAGSRVCLIDLQRVVRSRWRGRRWRIKDLAALNYATPRALLSDTDRLRWFRDYLQTRRLSRSDKALARAVLAKTRRIARHDRRRKRHMR